MKNLVVLVSLFLSISSIAQTKDETAMKYAETITIEDMKEDLTILASDALEGRETGERGQKMAAAYIKAHFEELGLVGPVQEGDPFYQNVPLKTSKPGEIYLTVGDKKLINLEDMYFYGDPITADQASTEVVFVGAGTEEDFASLDVKGKSALIINYNSAQRGKAMKSALKHGAELIFIVRLESDDKFNALVKRYSGYFGSGSIELDKDEERTSASAFYISPTTASDILGKSFEDLEKAIANKEKGKKKALHKVKSSTVSYTVNFHSENIISENVLGYLEGSDLKDEVLVLTAHYDHEGIINGEIYNGADDDGSGTVAVMDIAEAFVKAKADGNGPRRSILFLLVTAEEKGLLGSEYYADNPIFTLENTVANLNIDMIGRIDDRELESQSYVSLVGSDRISTELHEISENANKLYTNMFLDYTYNEEGHPERIYYRSDHWNFAKNGIPVIFYTTGSHPDYHKPTDTVEKIEFELMTKRAKLVFYTAWEVANKDGRLVIDKKQDDKASR